jgi:hypothetical protein
MQIPIGDSNDRAVPGLADLATVVGALAHTLSAPPSNLNAVILELLSCLIL